ncbi:discoidin domain-containing protein [Paenibacillus flagellatus]|uniref:F5/8 type C domain-containing protein n=1 Tax=Paenibacillus flagellatus TaxID=2211139 RepID=A0A2V5KY18_9BACL|nr:discoidin domain-containing protein [Paenibacillus flagellatus]PYI57487.1 hypothetical protein DLM86_03375 [Paenibacillus flagellatus]
MMKMKRWALAGLAGAMLAGSAGTAYAAVDYSAIVESEAEWIADQQLPSGAMIMSFNAVGLWEGKYVYKVEPYFANMAAVGMLEHPTPDHLDAAKRWMQWYFDHLNAPDNLGVDATMYVYYIDRATGEEYSTANYDSSDSSAATFLMLARKYAEAGGDRTFLVQNRTLLERIAGAALATQQPDGLTWAKMNYKIKYLMDNTEVHEGLGAAAWLEEYVFGDAVKAAYYAGKQAEVGAGLETLWMSAQDKYKHYYYTNPSTTTSWSKFYPDSTGQMWPILNGVIDPAANRARSLYDAFNLYWPEWQTLNNTTQFPWANLAYVAAKMGDRERVDAYIESVKAKYLDKGHPWTWYNNQSAYTAMAARIIRDQTNLARQATVTASVYAGTDALTDGKLFGGWTGDAKNSEWIVLDLGESRSFDRVLLKWGDTYSTKYKIQVSDDGVTFDNIVHDKDGDGGTDDIAVPMQHKRYVKLMFTHRSGPGGVELKEVELYRDASE